jgi:hypothetical protein
MVDDPYTGLSRAAEVESILRVARDPLTILNARRKRCRVFTQVFVRAAPFQPSPTRVERSLV